MRAPRVGFQQQDGEMVAGVREMSAPLDPWWGWYLRDSACSFGLLGTLIWYS
jgi:hypothetical protein